MGQHCGGTTITGHGRIPPLERGGAPRSNDSGSGGGMADIKKINSLMTPLERQTEKKMRTDNEITKEDRKASIEKTFKDQIQHQFDKEMKGWQELMDEAMSISQPPQPSKSSKSGSNTKRNIVPSLPKNSKKLSTNFTDL